MFRRLTENDREVYLALTRQFYASEAVLHPVPEENFLRTFCEVTAKSPYADCFLFEENGEAAGYALLSFQYSNEAGGLVVWLEEAYILEKFRSRGLMSAFFAFLETEYKEKCAGLRLEVERGNSRAVKLYEKWGFTPLDYFQMVKSF